MTFDASNELMAHLCDPLTRQPLRALTPPEVSALKNRVSTGTATRRGKDEFDGALISSDGRRAYPIVDGIPYLLVDEAIELDTPLST